MDGILKTLPDSEDRLAKVDMSPQAITRRLKLVSELRDVCLSLAKAGRQLRERSAQKPPLQAGSSLPQAPASRNSTR
jgi:hypothetical protein